MVFFWRNSPSVSEAGGLPGNAVRLRYVHLVPRPEQWLCGETSLLPKQPAVRCFWSAAPGAPTRSPLSKAAHSNLGSFNLCLSTGGRMGVSPNWNHGARASSGCPRCLPWYPQETQVREACTPLASSVGIPLPLPHPPCPPTSPVAPLQPPSTSSSCHGHRASGGWVLAPAQATLLYIYTSRWGIAILGGGRRKKAIPLGSIIKWSKWGEKEKGGRGERKQTGKLTWGNAIGCQSKGFDVGGGD